MPTVPVAKRTVRNSRVSPTFQRVDIRSGAFGSGDGLVSAGKMLQDLGDKAAVMAEKENEEDSKREARQKEIEYREKRRAILFGNEQNPGFYSLQGQNAIDQDPIVRKQLIDLQKEIQNTTTTRRSGELYGIASNRLLQSDLDAMGRQLVKNQTIADVNTSSSRILSAQQDVAVSNDPNFTAQQLGVIRNETINRGERQGWTPEQVELDIKKQISIAFSDQVKYAISTGDVDRAKELFDKYENHPDMLPAVAAGLRQTLKKPELVIESQREADKYLQSPESRSDVRKQIKTDLEGDLEDAVLKRVEQEWDIIDERRGEAGRAIRSKWGSAIAQGASFDDLVLKYPDEYDALMQDTVDHERGLRNAEFQRSRREEFPAKDDKALLDQLQQMSDFELSKQDPSTWRNSLSRGTFSTWERRFRVASLKNTNDAQMAAGQRLFYSMMRTTPLGKQLGFNKRTEITDEERKIQEAYTTFFEGWIAEQIAAGVEITPELMKNQMNALQYQLQPRNLFGAIANVTGIEDDIEDLSVEVPFFGQINAADFLRKEDATVFKHIIGTTPPEQLPTARVVLDEVPDVVVESARQTFKKNGIPSPSDDQLSELIAAHFLGQTRRARKLLGK